jgi:hypothetical protein
MSDEPQGLGLKRQIDAAGHVGEWPLNGDAPARHAQPFGTTRPLPTMFWANRTHMVCLVPAIG